MQYNIIANAQPFSAKLKLKIPHLVNIIALDGAANELFNIGVIPQILIGDLDSINENTLSIIRNSNSIIYHIANQNLTDLDKGIKFCDYQFGEKINIYNAIGGRLDHTLINLRMLKKYWKLDREISIFDDNSIIRYIQNKKITLHGNIGDSIAIMAFTKATINSKGLKYDMQKYRLKFAYQESTSNSLASNSAIIEITGNALLIVSENINIQS